MARGRGLTGARRRLDELDVGHAEAAVPDGTGHPPDTGEDDEGPLNEGPLNEGPLNEGPLNEEQWDEGPLEEGPRAEEQWDEGPPHGRFRRLRVASLAVLLVVAVGFSVGVWVGAPKYPGDDSADAGFARDMMIHHAQAVSMASLEFRSTSNDTLKTLAVDVMLTQQAQIGIMSTWLDTWGLSPTGSKGRMSWMPGGGTSLLVDGRMPGMATDAELATLRSDTGKARDLLFCQLMIKHHLGGIHMVDALLPLAHSSQVTTLAEQMKAGQQGEIQALQQIEVGLTQIR